MSPFFWTMSDKCTLCFHIREELPRLALSPELDFHSHLCVLIRTLSSCVGFYSYGVGRADIMSVRDVVAP